MAGFPSPEEFCLKVPLYKEFEVSKDNIENVSALLLYAGHLDAYCPQCKSHTVSNCKSSIKAPWIHDENWYGDLFFNIYSNCSRNKNHVSIYTFRASQDSGIQKIGQYPSTAESNLFDVKKYSKVLGAEEFKGFTKAIGLAAHGIGAGSLVYLRRIFESLIKEAQVIASKEPEWDEVAYNNGRMQDRVKLLKDHLPSFLVDHHKIYSVMSSGVHELSEADCLEFFPLLKISIELILDQKILESEKQRKTQDVSKFLSKFDQMQSK
ncbi:short-chain dehydrogenase [Pseudomonas sp. Sample_11]|uniref:short-chain dehydrogenase n=1 Tax=Pseudomonas sp. Sample_11 TaxID=2448261 RepID=UPI001032F8E9|nr:short-chain dehydrogenase [Pseudomonas sp. Sample_11]